MSEIGSMSKGSLTPHVLVVEARFYEDIGDALYQGAAAVLDAAGVTHERVAVPGAFAIPAAIRMAVRSMDFFAGRSEEHTSDLQSLMRISYAVFCLKKKQPNSH